MGGNQAKSHRSSQDKDTGKHKHEEQSFHDLRNHTHDRSSKPAHGRDKGDKYQQFNEPKSKRKHEKQVFERLQIDYQRIHAERAYLLKLVESIHHHVKSGHSKSQTAEYHLPSLDGDDLQASMDKPNYQVREIADILKKEASDAKSMKKEASDAKSMKEKFSRKDEELYGVRQELETLKRDLNEKIRQYEKDLEGKNDKIKELEEEINYLLKRQELDTTTRDFNEKIRNCEKDLEQKNKKITQLQEEKNDLLNRLSSEAAARMTYNNPNITDLSDQDRPTKISERYSELYDNEWTDAFDILQKNHKLSETKAIELLLDVLFVSFDVCKDARTQRENLLKALNLYVGANVDDQDTTVLEVMRTLKGAKKRNVALMRKKYKKRVKEKLLAKYKEELQYIKPYMNECVKICILMNIQEPPLELKGMIKPGEQMDMDLTHFKPYTESGNTIKYIVWPAIYLCRDGALLSKGIAQGRSETNDANGKESEVKGNVKQETSKVESTKSTKDKVANDTNNVENQKKNEKNEYKINLKASSTSKSSHGEKQDETLSTTMTEANRSVRQEQKEAKTTTTSRKISSIQIGKKLC